MIEPLDLDRMRSLALAWLEYACNGTRGRPEGDPIYDAITEGRDTGKRYSSCGDLAHWLLFRLGLRSPWLNRSEHLGWRMGRNISRLAGCPVAERPAQDARFEAGDILIIWSKPDSSDAHALVVREHVSLGNPVGIVVRSADYGQPGGAYRERPLVRGARGSLVLGGRTVQRVLPLEAAVSRAWALGQLVSPEAPPGYHTERPPAPPELVS